MKKNNPAKKASPFKRLVLLAIVAFAAIGLAITACSEPNAASIDLSFISVTKSPTKTIYAIGDSLKTDGIVVTAAYTDGSKKEVTGYSTSGFDSSTAGLKTVTVTFEGKTTTFNVTVSDKIVATPRANLRTGEYFASQSVTLSTTTEGATIRYTLDGTTPTASSAAYSAAISISANTSLRAVAYKDGWTESGVLSADYFLTSMTADKWIDGRLSSASDEQWFKFTATDAYQRVYFMSGTSSSVYVNVIDYESLKTVPSGLAYTSTTDRVSLSSGGYLERTLVADKDYFIRITNSGYSGTYKIAFTAGITQPVMTFPDSVPELTRDTWTDGNIPVLGGEQWFKFTAPAAATTNYIHFMNGSMMGVRTYVYNSEGAAVGSYSDLSLSSSYKNVSVTANSTYYVRLLAASYIGTYKIAFASTNATPKIPTPVATPLTEKIWVDGEFTETVREQWYSFTATAATQYIYFQRGTLTADMCMEVYNSAGERIASNYSGINPGYEPLSAFASNSTYYLRVFLASSSAKGTYKIGFAKDRNITPPTTATELLADTWTDGNIPAASDEQWFKFKAAQSGNTTYIHFDFGTLKGINVIRYTDDGTYIGQTQIKYDSAWPYWNPWNLVAGTNYYIKVTPSFSETDTAYNSGTYKIGFTQSATTKPGVVTNLPAMNVTILEPNTTVTVNAVKDVEQWFKVKKILTTLTVQDLMGTLKATVYTANGIKLDEESSLTNNASTGILSNADGDEYYLKLTPSNTGTYKIKNESAASEIIELLSPYAWVDGNITTSEKSQVFRFTAPSSAQFILLDTTGTLNNVYVQVYNALTGSTVGSQANLNAGTSYTYVTSLTKGAPYFIKVSPRDNNGTGTYKIAYNVTPVQSPVSLTKDVEANGAIPNTANREQWFKFTATSEGKVISLTSVTMSNTTVQLYSADGKVGGEVTGTTSFNLTRSATIGDTYYIQVKSANSGTFKIKFIEGYVTPPPPSTPLTVGTWTNGNITIAGGVQWFSFTATASTQYINFDNSGTLKAVKVQLYQDDGTTVVGTSSNLFGGTSNASKTVTYGNTYLIKVEPYSASASGTFKIGVSGGSAMSVPPLSESSISDSMTVGTWATGSITVVGGVQWFKFVASANPQWIHFDTTGTMNDVNVQLYTADGTAVESSANLWSSSKNTSRPVTPGETYLMKVWSYYVERTGTFKIGVTTSSAILPTN